MTVSTVIALLLAFTAAFIATRASIDLVGSAASVAMTLANGPWLAPVRDRVGRDLGRLARDGESASEWLAAAITHGAAAAAGAVVLVGALGLAAIPVHLLPPAAALAGTFALAVTCAVAVNGLRVQAEARVRRIVRLLPYSVELVVLIAEAGGSLEDGLSAVVDSMPGEPLSAEFGRALSEQRLGRPFLDALRGIAGRVNNKETTQLVTSLEIGRELGTPLAASLSTFAEWIRTKRVLDGERLAREAAPKMALPNTMIMAANVLLILAPFVPALTSGAVL
jgi:Flp pilus assembly protein TadB